MLQNQSRRQIHPKERLVGARATRGASVPRSTHQASTQGTKVPRPLDPGPAAHPWGAPALPHQYRMDPGMPDDLEHQTKSQ